MPYCDSCLSRKSINSRSIQDIITTCYYELTKEENKKFLRKFFEQILARLIFELNCELQISSANDHTSHDFFILIIRPRIFDTIGIIAQDKLSVNFRYFKAFKVSFSYSQDPDDKNVRSG